MLEGARLFVILGAVHLFGYTIPRWLHILFVRLPVSLWELITMKRPFTYGFRRERHIKVIATTKNTAARAQNMERFGLTEEMQYTGPLYNRHIHTIFGAMRLCRRVKYERELVDADDGNPICLDWLTVPETSKVKAKAVLLIVPGLGNYGQTNYIQRLVRAAVKRGYHCCVLTTRGMGSAPLTVPQLTCVTFTTDVRTSLRKHLHLDQIEARFGAPLPLFALGYSAGGSTLIKTMAEEELAIKADAALYGPRGFSVSACVSIQAPYDMFAHAHGMLTPTGRRLYQSAMMSALRKYTIKHRAVLLKGLKGLEFLTEDNLKEYLAQLETVEDFDEHIVAPHFGYGHAANYYEDASAFKWLPHIARTPTVCLAARDDPIASYGCTADAWQQLLDTSNNVTYVETPVGGHLGYVLGPISETVQTDCFLITFALDRFDSFVSHTRKEL